MDAMQEVNEYSKSIMESLVPIVNEYVICRMKIQQLRTKVDIEALYPFNESLVKMLETLQANVDNAKLDLLFAIEAPFMDKTKSEPVK